MKYFPSKPYVDFYFTPFIRFGRVQKMWELSVATPIDTDARGPRGETFLHEAAEWDQPESCKFLLEKGADPNATDNNSSTPLHYAARAGSLRVVKTLVEKGANTEAPALNMFTPLMVAAIHNNPLTVKALLDAGADPTARTKHMSVMTCARSGYVERDTIINMLEKAIENKEKNE